MKRLLIACILQIVTLAGALHANYIERERGEGITISEAYKDLYPETLAFDPVTHYLF